MFSVKGHVLLHLGSSRSVPQAVSPFRRFQGKHPALRVWDNGMREHKHDRNALLCVGKQVQSGSRHEPKSFSWRSFSWWKGLESFFFYSSDPEPNSDGSASRNPESFSCE